MRARVEQRADELGIRCGAKRVLHAVLTLLLDWDRIRDTRVRVHHIAARFPAATRLVTDDTIGRLLAKLDADRLIVYRAAQGRGTYAGIAIHPDFLDGISELNRRPNGRIIANSSAEITDFSDPRFLIGDLSPTTLLPPSSGEHDEHADGPADTRPTEVPVESASIREVLRAIPDCYRSAPARVRGCIAREIRRYLARGWRPAQVIDILGSQLPRADVRFPLRLAQWRLTQNMLGAGPELEPLQRKWDAEQAERKRSAHASDLAVGYHQVLANLGADLTDRLAAAVLGSAADTDADPAIRRHRAVTHAARMVRREYPGWPLDAATNAWLAVKADAAITAAIEPTHAPAIDGMLTVGQLMAITPSGRCASCGSIGAVIREELPLRSAVCDRCWYTPSIANEVLHDEISPRSGPRDPWEYDPAERWEAS